jgi:hypothetical protein
MEEMFSAPMTIKIEMRVPWIAFEIHSVSAMTCPSHP